ncbi:MAG: acyl-CoA dehydrogenase family protein, partial [Desulfatiglandales bacterium]
MSFIRRSPFLDVADIYPQSLRIGGNCTRMGSIPWFILRSCFPYKKQKARDCKRFMGACTSVYLSFPCRNDMGFQKMILLFGSEEQKRKYLTPVCKGEAISAFAVTEPDAGSDVLSVRTRAEEVKDGYLINGSKMFISNGTIADFMVALCLTDPDADSRHGRHSVIVVEADRPGVTRKKLRGKLGIRAHDTAEVSFSNVLVPFENLVGEQGKGFKYFIEFVN